LVKSLGTAGLPRPCRSAGRLSVPGRGVLAVTVGEGGRVGTQAALPATRRVAAADKLPAAHVLRRAVGTLVVLPRASPGGEIERGATVLPKAAVDLGRVGSTTPRAVPHGRMATAPILPSMRKRRSHPLTENGEKGAALRGGRDDVTKAARARGANATPRRAGGGSRRCGPAGDGARRPGPAAVAPCDGSMAIPTSWEPPVRPGRGRGTTPRTRGCSSMRREHGYPDFMGRRTTKRKGQTGGSAGRPRTFSVDLCWSFSSCLRVFRRARNPTIYAFMLMSKEFSEKCKRPSGYL
jgi:hypothetical protein